MANLDMERILSSSKSGEKTQVVHMLLELRQRGLVVKWDETYEIPMAKDKIMACLIPKHIIQKTERYPDSSLECNDNIAISRKEF